MTRVSRGKVKKRTWTWEGKKRTAYYFDVAVNGKRERRQYPSQAEAESALDAFREEQRKPVETIEPPLPVLTLAQAAERYLAEKARKRSLFADRRIMAHLKAALGENTPLADITANRISEYKAKRLATKSDRRKDVTGGTVTLSSAAVNRPLTILRHLLRLAHEEWGVLAAVPKIRLEREPQGRLRWLTQAEATKLLAACRKSRNIALADVVEFALFTGVRKSEALGLTWDRVDRARGVIRLELTKSGKRREVPLSSNADAVLARRWTDGAKGYVFGSHKWNSFRTAWETAVAASGVDDVRFHDLRHTFASWLVQRGRTLKEVQEALGHQTITMTMRYSHLAPDHLRAAVAALDGVLAPQADEMPDDTTTSQEVVQQVESQSSRSVVSRK
jgi:integrase